MLFHERSIVAASFMEYVKLQQCIQIKYLKPDIYIIKARQILPRRTTKEVFLDSALLNSMFNVLQ